MFRRATTLFQKILQAKRTEQGKSYVLVAIIAEQDSAIHATCQLMPAVQGQRHALIARPA